MKADNKFFEKGIQILCGALLKNTTLLKLKLEKNEIGYKGSPALLNMLSKNNSLIELDILNNGIPKSAIKKINILLRKNRQKHFSGFLANSNKNSTIEKLNIFTEFEKDLITEKMHENLFIIKNTVGLAKYLLESYEIPNESYPQIKEKYEIYWKLASKSKILSRPLKIETKKISESKIQYEILHDFSGQLIQNFYLKNDIPYKIIIEHMIKTLEIIVEVKNINKKCIQPEFFIISDGNIKFANIISEIQIQENSVYFNKSEIYSWAIMFYQILSRKFKEEISQEITDHIISQGIEQIKICNDPNNIFKSHIVQILKSCISDKNLNIIDIFTDLKNINLN